MAETQPRNFNTLTPLFIGAELPIWAGGIVYRQVRQRGENLARRVGSGIMNVVDTRHFVKQRVTHWFEDEEAAAVEEIIKRPNDFQLVDLNAMRWVRTAMAHAEDRAGASNEYIEQIEKIMRDSGVVADRTIEVAVDKLRATQLDSFAPVIDLRSVLEPEMV